MSANVEPEEAQAIRELVAGTQQTMSRSAVERRNFQEPRRLSSDTLRTLGKQVATLLPRVSAELAGPLRKLHKLTLGSCSEVNASRLFSDLQSPFVVWCFRCSGQLGWLIWENLAARHLVEVILTGKFEQQASARRFSAAECRVIERVLGSLVSILSKEFDLSPESVRIAQDAEDLNGLDLIPESEDKQRMMVHLSFDGPGGISDLRIYLPGVLADAQEAKRLAPIKAVPEHAKQVPIVLSAFLGSVDVPLSELLGLEVGDVLPLSIDTNAPLELFVEDQACARAHWGKLKGQLAIQITEVDPHQLEIDQPDIDFNPSRS